MTLPLYLNIVYKLVYHNQHTKSNNVSESVRAKILGLVKAAIAWKQVSRTSEEVEAYVKNLNGAMGEIVKKL